MWDERYATDEYLYGTEANTSRKRAPALSVISTSDKGNFSDISGLWNN